MLIGISYALAACLIWGLIFVVPGFMPEFNAIEIAFGRYLVYGSISTLFLLKSRLNHHGSYPLKIWLKATHFSLMATVVYYISLVLALRYANPAICALILGVSPITIAFYGNWKQRECSFKHLILPSVLILVGLLIMNAPHLMNNEAASEYALGLLLCLISLLAWSWYVVANAKFIKDHPHIPSNEWSTLIGVTSLIWIGLLGLFFGIFYSDSIDMTKYITISPELMNFIYGSLALGVLCSWLGAFLWNKASPHLPVAIAGQLTIFETVFGLCFVYLLKQELPPIMECLGITLLLTAVGYGMTIPMERESIETHS
ncbi:MAG: DMT family transporter [Parachlamydiaceae bacterium]|nr:DMT family transporter [Parachlamydiaceae bacterium]